MGETRAMEPILVEGLNCWRSRHARRVRFLIDAADYFATFAEAAERAERSIVILGWDVNSKIRLRPEDPSTELGVFFKRLVDEKPELEIHTLNWNYLALYQKDRERGTAERMGAAAHPRLHYSTDACHPALGCHHQKVAVIDDRLAFVGGLDFSAARWDTQEHRQDDPRRLNIRGEVAPPFHDVMIMVDDEAAASLAELARDRWLQATGKPIEPVKGAADPWPPDRKPDLENVAVAIARTVPAYADQTEVREIERQTLDAITAARREIYIENQYVTAMPFGDALASRLGESDGPEVVIVTSRASTDWLEGATMGVLRARFLDHLRTADRHRRLRVYYPVVPDIGDRYVKVHSKVLVIDGVFARVGSSNLCNRSMGVDTECDLSIEARSDASVRRAIEHLRNRLLSEHLGVSVEVFQRSVDRGQSLIETIDDLRSGERTLEDLDGAVERWLDTIVPGEEVIDPRWPLSAPRRWFPLVYPEDVRGTAQYSLVVSVLLVVTLAGLGLAWQLTPLGEAIQPERLAALARSVRDDPAAPLLVTGAYVAGTALMVPLNVMIFATALTFSPTTSFAYAWIGAVVAGAATYAVGRALGRDVVRRLGGERAVVVSRRIAQQGLLAVTALRLLPIAPYGVVNLMAGAAEIRFLDYTIGTGIGLLPGIAAITLFEAQLEKTLERPGLGSFALLGGMAVAMLGASWALGRWLRRSESVAGPR